MNMNMNNILLSYFSIGDWGAYYPKNREMIKNAFSINNMYHKYKPKFIVALGDNFYDCGVNGLNDDKWNTIWYDNFIRPFPNLHHFKWCAILGNHDYDGGEISVMSQIEKTSSSNNWIMPNNEYHLYDSKSSSYHIFIDTCKIYPELYQKTNYMIREDDIKHSLQFIEKHLIIANNLNSKWICVYGHYHIFSNGYYGNYNVMIERLLPLFIKYNVNIYFSGHEHTHQLLKYNNIYFCINGVGAFVSPVYYKNKLKDVLTYYTDNSSIGFISHVITNNEYILNFIDNHNNTKYTHNIN